MSIHTYTGHEVAYSMRSETCLHTTTYYMVLQAIFSLFFLDAPNSTPRITRCSIVCHRPTYTHLHSCLRYSNHNLSITYIIHLTCKTHISTHDIGFQTHILL